MKKSPRMATFIAAAALFLVLPACQEREAQKPAAPADQKAVPAPTKTQETAVPPTGSPSAVAHLQPTQGNNVSGVVTFTQAANGLEITGEFQGLPPGRHGFHIHEKGDCSAPDASSAGDHFNVEGAPHGAPENPPAKRHTGDLGNIEAGTESTARYSRIDQVLSLEGPHAIIGKAIVVHAGEDDLTSQPAGNSGPRVACGVIEQKSR